ncbi:Ubiquitin-conjugating enzyme E2 J1 [Zancudomyces culisetae]|uniref:Ubiquitin-conjugating enzyme E2 J1 n=1 Tax=Zancudomyces culisetae TaxID=1213189 RepID=A0A1R1PL11_ZANCU|nr:Ubiquitin-conjugating enzyme E2 J1 [Zancudomyces culisetae]|eukprot:OMH81613.1 Ubiquitin-conjugating enzyme E2 J1 [Zancudomyces culisetae]
MDKGYNLNNPGVRRILKEWRDLQREESQEFTAFPTEDNIFDWHFTIRGPPGTPFSGGKYHGRIILPSEYPLKPPSVIFMTKNGRFETNKKICLSFTEYHPETWLPSWGIRTVLLAIISFLPTKGEGAIGSLDHSDEVRMSLAKDSNNFVCSTCFTRVADILNNEPTIIESGDMLKLLQRDNENENENKSKESKNQDKKPIKLQPSIPSQPNSNSGAPGSEYSADLRAENHTNRTHNEEYGTAIVHQNTVLPSVPYDTPNPQNTQQANRRNFGFFSLNIPDTLIFYDTGIYIILALLVLLVAKKLALYLYQ